MKRLFASSMASFGGLSACVLAFAATASTSAAIIGTATKVRNPPATPFTAPDAALGAPWVSYVLSVESTTAQKITAVDVKINGPLHQRWNFDADESAYVPTPIGTNRTNGDSKLLSAGGLLFASTTEDNPGTGSPLASTVTALYGVGSKLSGAVGYPLNQEVTRLEFAYIAVPSDRLHEISISVSVADPLGNIIAELRTHDFLQITTTEPSFLSVSGNGVAIADGDATPSIVDGTDFGTVVAGAMAQREFKIKSVGIGPVQLQPPVFTGPYSLVGDFPASVSSGSMSFTVALDTNVGPGVHPGSISFGNTASGNVNPYNFALTTRVIPEPASWSIAGLAMVGCILKARRRRG